MQGQRRQVHRRQPRNRRRRSPSGKRQMGFELPPFGGEAAGNGQPLGPLLELTNGGGQHRGQARAPAAPPGAGRRPSRSPEPCLEGKRPLAAERRDRLIPAGSGSSSPRNLQRQVDPLGPDEARPMATPVSSTWRAARVERKAASISSARKARTPPRTGAFTDSLLEAQKDATERLEGHRHRLAPDAVAVARKDPARDATSDAVATAT